MPRDSRSPSPAGRVKYHFRAHEKEYYGKRRVDDRERDYKRRRDSAEDGDQDARRRDAGYRERAGDRRGERHYDRDSRREEREYRERRGGPSSRRSPGSPQRRSVRPRSRSRSHSPPRQRSRSASVVSEKDKNKGKPNFNQSGLLAAETNNVKLADGTTTVLKYNEPPEARKPLIGWRLYVFKGKEQTDLLHIQRQSAYLVGRDKAVVDIYVEHPSCSKQHAVIQHRQVQEKDEFGASKPVIKPFVIDLESTNGTLVNDEPIPTARYYELKIGDVIKFGQSNREYVLLHDDA